MPPSDSVKAILAEAAPYPLTETLKWQRKLRALAISWQNRRVLF
jgi:hypothetical protein